MSSEVELTDSQLAELTKGIQIPPQPLTVIEVQHELQKPEPDLHVLAEIISKDLGVAAGVIKTVNSPLFGLRREVSSIDRSVQMLGVRNIKNIVAGIAIRESVNKRGSPAMDRFLDSANDCALACSYLARELHVMAPEDAFTLGLFHDIGIPMMIMRFPNYKEVLVEANRDATFSLTEIEDRHLGTNHAVVGYLVARSWKLPHEICDAIFNHHRAEELLNAMKVEALDEAQSRGLPAMVSLLVMAEHVSYAYRKRGDFHEWERMGRHVLELFSLETGEFEELKGDIWAALGDAA